MRGAVERFLQDALTEMVLAGGDAKGMLSVDAAVGDRLTLSGSSLVRHDEVVPKMLEASHPFVSRFSDQRSDQRR